MLPTTVSKRGMVREAQESDVFGRWAWPAWREDISDPTAQAEPDTPVEHNAWIGLAEYFVKNSQPSPGTAAAVRKCLDEKTYDDVIHEPPAGTVLYRGMEFDSSTNLPAFLDALGVDPDFRGRMDVSATYKNRGEVSGWSHDPELMDAFVPPESARDEYAGVVLEARVDDNPGVFVDGPDGLYKVTSFARHKHEAEAIAVRDVRIRAIRVGVYRAYDGAGI